MFGLDERDLPARFARYASASWPERQLGGIAWWPPAAHRRGGAGAGGGGGWLSGAAAASGAGGGGARSARVGTRRGRRGSQHVHQDRAGPAAGRPRNASVHRQVHVMAELRLVGAAATNAHATAFAAGDRSSVGQRHRGVAAVPADHQSAGRGPVLEATCQQRRLFIAGVEPAAESRPVGCDVRYQGGQTRTVRTRAAEFPPVTYGVPDIC